MAVGSLFKSCSQNFGKKALDRLLVPLLQALGEVVSCEAAVCSCPVR